MQKEKIVTLVSVNCLIYSCFYFYLLIFLWLWRQQFYNKTLPHITSQCVIDFRVNPLAGNTRGIVIQEKVLAVYLIGHHQLIIKYWHFLDFTYSKLSYFHFDVIEFITPPPQKKKHRNHESMLLLCQNKGVIVTFPIWRPYCTPTWIFHLADDSNSKCINVCSTILLRHIQPTCGTV